MTALAQAVAKPATPLIAVNATRAAVETGAWPAGADAEDVPVAVLLGTGLVGGALLALLRETQSDRAPLRLLGVANSRHRLLDAAGIDCTTALQRLDQAPASDLDAVAQVLQQSGARTRLVIDATPAASVAARHGDWLAQGIHVVTANKIAQGTSLQSWQAIQQASARGNTRYGDSATVGAGLPALPTLRRLRRSGDRLLRLEGVLSGSLSFLFNHYDGSQPFSALLQQARERGYTEPDPRADLSGADVARKLLILARAAGIALDESDVQVSGLVPEHLVALDSAAFLARLDEVDIAIQAQFDAAKAQGKVLRYIGTIEADGKARVGLTAVGVEHPCASLRGADNLFVLTTTRYRERPLVIGGPGAGAEVTAQGLLADALEIAAA